MSPLPIFCLATYSIGLRETVREEFPLCRIILESCIYPSPLCGVSRIGETPKKQWFLRRGVGIYKDNPHELSTEPSSYSSQKDFFRLSSKEWITLKAEIIHTENKTNNPLVFIRHYHLRIPTRGLSQSIRFLKT